MSISNNLVLTAALDLATYHIAGQRFGHAYQVIKNFHNCYPSSRALDLCTARYVADDLNDLIYHFEALDVDILGIREDAIEVLMSMVRDDRLNAIYS